MSTKTKTSTQTTAAPASSTTISSKQYGWICPVCGAVMGPLERTCINRHDTWQRPPYYDPWYPYYPYWYHVTCGPDGVTTSAGTIDKDAWNINTCTSGKGDASTYTTTTTWN